METMPAVYYAFQQDLTSKWQNFKRPNVYVIIFSSGLW